MSFSSRLAGIVAGSYTRVQGVATEQTIKAIPGNLYRIVVTNANAGVQTLTVSDGASPGGDVGVYEIPVDTTLSLEFNLNFATDIRVTPSDAGIDALIIFD